MNRFKIQSSVRIVFSVLVLLMIASVSTTAQTESVGNRKLVGVWDTLVTIRNCSDGSALATFPALGRFESGGTMTNQDVGNIRTPVPGVWAFVGPDRYKFAFKAFQYGSDGAYNGYLIVRHDVSMAFHGNEYTSEGTVTIYSPTGAELGSGCSTTVATRMVLD